jgi:hypothetical protein
VNAAPMTTTPPATNLEHALAYARRGWRVVPVPAGRKVPTITAWQREGTTDEARITHWWTQAPDHGIGIVCGEASGLWVLDVDVAGDKAGDETLAELTDAYGPLPETFEVVTGSGGRHVYFAWTPGCDVRNSASGALGPGIDVRGEGGFVVAPPSLHASGRRYEHEASSPTHLAAPPEWLLAKLERSTDEVVRPPAVQRSDRPGDQWAASTTWDALLSADGWTKMRPGPEGEDRWCRPGKEPRDGPSATVGYGGSDVLKVFTSSHPVLRAEETYTKVGYLAFTRFGGDFTEARRWCEAQGFGGERFDVRDLVGEVVLPPPAPEPAPDEGDWSPIDLRPVLSGNHNPPAPTIATPSGCPPLFYPGRCNAVFGESGTGKTWVALAAIVEVLNGGGTAMLIDLEDSAHGITSRLLALGVDVDTIHDRFLYLAPQTGWGVQAQAAMATLLAERSPELVVLDSTGEAMAASGVKGNDDDDVARWFVTFPKFIAHRGPGVVIIDHVPKDPNAPSRYMIGSQRKTAAIDGASYRIEAVKVPSRTDDGLLKIIVAKDRHGTRPQGTTAAMMHITHSLTGMLSLHLTAPEAPPMNPDGTFRPTVYMERVSRFLEAMPGSSTRAIVAGVEGKSKFVQEAIGVLLVDGYIEQDSTARGFAYSVVTAYREGGDPVTHGSENATDSVNDPVDNPTVSRVSHRVPPCPGHGQPPPCPVSHPLRGDTVAGADEEKYQRAYRVPPSEPVDNLPPDPGHHDPLDLLGGDL